MTLWQQSNRAQTNLCLLAYDPGHCMGPFVCDSGNDVCMFACYSSDHVCMFASDSGDHVGPFTCDSGDHVRMFACDSGDHLGPFACDSGDHVGLFACNPGTCVDIVFWAQGPLGAASFQLRGWLLNKRSVSALHLPCRLAHWQPIKIPASPHARSPLGRPLQSYCASP